MQIYLVGGAVRDELLGLEVVDRDFVVVGASPQTLLDLGYSQVGKDFPVFLHPQSKEEYALARTERKAGKGYTGFTCYAAEDVTLEEDLQRRDLTINAIAKSSDGELIDPFDGVKDLKQRVLRHVSPAFSEDPLRVLRVARFAARLHPFGFTIAPSTWQLMQHMVATGELTELSRERVWQELSRSLTGPAPHVFCQLLSDLEAWPQLLSDSDHPCQLQPVDWHLLRSAAASNQELPLSALFGLFFLSLQQSNPQLTPQHLQQVLRVPNESADVSALLLRFETLMQTHEITPAEVIQMLKLADPIRRPQRWQDALAAEQVMANAAAQPGVNREQRLERLILAQKAYSEVAPGDYLDAGLSGADIGKAIAQQRLQAVTDALNADPDSSAGR